MLDDELDIFIVESIHGEEPAGVAKVSPLQQKANLSPRLPQGIEKFTDHFRNIEVLLSLHGIEYRWLIEAVRFGIRKDVKTGHDGERKGAFPLVKR